MDARPHDAGESEDAPATDPTVIGSVGGGADEPVADPAVQDAVVDPVSGTGGDGPAGGLSDGPAGRVSGTTSDGPAGRVSGTGEELRASPGGAGSAEAPSPLAASSQPGADDVDAQWRDLVARLEGMGSVDLPPDPSPAPGALGPGRGPVLDRRGRVVRDAGDPVEDTPRSAAESGPRVWSPDPVAAEAEDHFDPPDPGPVLAGDPLLTLAWSAVIGVPLLLMLVAVVWRDAPSVVVQVAGALFLIGLGLLLWRMPHGDDEPRGPGAVV